MHEEAFFDLFCSRDLDPMIFTDTSCVQLRTSYVEAFESYRLTDRQIYIQTDRTKITYHAASLVVNKDESGS